MWTPQYLWCQPNCITVNLLIKLHILLPTSVSLFSSKESSSSTKSQPSISLDTVFSNAMERNRNNFD